MTTPVVIGLILATTLISVLVGFLLANGVLAKQFAQRLTDSENSNAQLKSEAAMAVAKRAEMEQNLAAVLEAHNQTKIEMSRVNAEKSMLDEQLLRLNKDIDEIKISNSQLQEQVTDLTGRFNAANSVAQQFEELEKKHNENLARIQVLTNIKSEKAIIDEQLSDVKSTLAEKEKILDELQQKYSEVIGKYNSAKTAAENYNELDERYQKAQLQIQELIGVKEKLEEEVKQTKISTQKQIDLAKEGFEERLDDLEKIKKDLQTQFNVISQKVLDENSDRFLKSATEHLKLVEEKIKSELTIKTDKVESIIMPVNELIKNLNVQLSDIEIKREKAYAEIDIQVKGLSNETHNLFIALRKPQTRGRWGELQLRNVVELAGLSEHCDFIEQHQIKGEVSDLRPDLIVKLPGDREIAIDAKVPLEAYLSAIESKTEGDRNAHMKTHAKKIEQHIKQLASKEYQSNIGRTVDFVVLFIPGENFFSAALEANIELIEFGMKNKVLLSSPTTLIALLKAVAYGWQQDKMFKNIEDIKREAATLFDRLQLFVEHFAKLGHKINDVSKTFNAAKGSYQTRLLPSVNRFKQLGVSEKTLLDVPETTEIFIHDVAQLEE